METFSRKKHWEHIYETKVSNEVSWYQSNPVISLDFIRQFNVPKAAKIIDIGGGDSFFVDHLLMLDYTDITVLDISENAIKRAKSRLGKKADSVKWIIADVAIFHPKEQYDFWHDRATFHFLTDENEIANYIETAQRSINKDGVLIVGTFSEQGPKKCSGIEIKQYSETSLTTSFERSFEKMNCFTMDHRTPFDTTQNFVFCSFRKK